MSITLELDPELERQVTAAADARGLPVEAYVLSLIKGNTPPLPREPVDLAEFEAALDEMAVYSDQIPVLPPEALSRELIYSED